MNNVPDKKSLIDAIVSSSGGKINRQDVNNAANGDLSGILGALSADDRKKLLNALSDEKAAKQLLSSSAAQQLLKLFENGGKSNG